MSELEQAKQNDPLGIVCGHCGKPNNFVDDIGWFYCGQEDIKLISLPVCKVCWDGEVGRRHIERYGFGER